MISLLTSTLLMTASLGAAAAPKDKPRAPMAQHFDFDDDQVEGDVAGAGGETVRSSIRPRWPGLIRVRASFIPELLQSAEDR
jgi:hypothetical protein